MPKRLYGFAREVLYLLIFLSFIDDDSQKALFEEIYYKYRKQMIITAKTVVSDDSSAEDVVHDVFLKIAIRHMNTIEKLETEQDIRNYLLKSVKNTALNHIKAKDNSNTSEESNLFQNHSEQHAFSDNEFVNMICEKMDYDKVVIALLKLNEPYRTTMYYHFVLDLSIRQVSKNLGIKESTVTKQINRGKKLLMQLLDEE